MRIQPFLLLTFSLFILSTPIISAQNLDFEVYSKGGDVQHSHGCLSSDARAQKFEKIEANKKHFNIGEENMKSAAADELIFPIIIKEDIAGLFKFYATSAFVDQDNSSNFSDFDCLNKGFDGHQGSDFYIFPFPWYLYENDLVEVVAATSGTIVLKEDGNSDSHCSLSGNWNAIYVMHDDGSTIWYGHLKTGSLTAKGVGDTVEQGEFLGIVGSSGASYSLALHIECYDENNNLTDPFDGICNDAPNSLWQEQVPHSETTVNAVLTHKSEPIIDCGLNNEQVSFENEFYLDEVVYIGFYITDYVAGETFNVQLETPNGFSAAGFEIVDNANSYLWYYTWISLPLTEELPEGRWRIICEYQGQQFINFFEFNKTPSAVDENNALDFQVYPNPTDSKLILDGLGNSKMDFKLNNLLGVEIIKGEIRENEISLRKIPSGVYILNIISDNKIIGTKKIFKQD